MLDLSKNWNLFFECTNISTINLLLIRFTRECRSASQLTNTTEQIELTDVQITDAMPAVARAKADSLETVRILVQSVMQGILEKVGNTKHQAMSFEAR